MDDRCSDYKYMKIKDAITSVDQNLCFFGVVLEISLPKNPKAQARLTAAISIISWYYCYTLKIVDESHHNPVIPVTFFAERVDWLPRVSSAGDIIQLSDITMKVFKGEASAVYNKRFSSFALYEGKDGVTYLPYRSSSKVYRRDQDKKIIAGLRKWLADARSDEASNDFLLLREIKEEKPKDIACKILHSSKVAKDFWMVFVWDGTDTRPGSIQAPLEDEMYKQLPLYQLPLSRDLLCTLPTVGTILRVIIDPSIQKHFLHLLNAGQWIKFLNVLFKADAGSWCGVLTPETRLRYMFTDDVIWKESQRLHESRLSMKMGRMSLCCFLRLSLITEINCDERVPCRTLMDVLTHSEATFKFKCVVQVVSALPCRADDFCSPSGTYRIRLTLEDPTARIHAFIYAKDGELFFGGYPPTDVLERKWKNLLGVAVGHDGKEIKGASRSPPWVQCCLKSHYLDKNNRRGSRQNIWHQASGLGFVHNLVFLK